MKPQYRYDQIGSLLRPTALLDARDRFAEGKISKDDLRSAEDKAVDDALAMQKDVGVDVYTDGEMRRGAWQTNLMEAVSGFAAENPIRELVDADGKTHKIEMHTKPIVGRLSQTDRIAGVDAQYLAKKSPGAFKITMPSPSFIASMSYQPGVTDKAYATREECHSELVGLIAGEMKNLINDGAVYLQLDEGFTRYASSAWREMAKGRGLDLEQELEIDIDADNACYDQVSGDDVTLAMHLCRGSRVSFDRGTGTYDWLAERLFDRLHVDRFLLEYDSERVGGFEPLRFMPKGKVAVLGIVCSTHPELEDIDELLRRLEKATKYCSPDQLAVSSQCGFQGAADRDGAHMGLDQQRRKMELIGEVSRRFFN